MPFVYTANVSIGGVVIGAPVDASPSTISRIATVANAFAATQTWPTAATTGTSGSLTAQTISPTATGQTFQNLNITFTGGAGTVFTGDNCTFINCQFPSNQGFRSQVTGLTITDCTFPDGMWISSGQNIVITRAEIQNFTADGIHITSDAGQMCDGIEIHDSFINNSTPPTSAFADGIQVRGSVGLWLEGNYINMGAFAQGKYSSLLLQEVNGGNSGLLIEGNFFKGGEYTCYLDTGSGTFQNNVLGLAGTGYFGPPSISTNINGSGNMTEGGQALALHPIRPSVISRTVSIPTPAISAPGSPINVSRPTISRSAAFATPTVSAGGGSGSWPTANTTGATGSLTTTTINGNASGQTFQNLYVTAATGTDGPDLFMGDNNTFINCRFAGTFIFRNADGTSLTDCTFDNGFAFSSSSNCTVTRGKIMNFTGDAMHVTSDSGYMCTNILIQDTFVQGSFPDPGHHADGIQIRGSNGVHLDNCYIDTGTGFNSQINACVYFEQDNGGNSNFFVENCWFRAHGYYLAYLDSGTGTVINNKWVLTGATAPPKYWYPNDTMGPGVTHYGNVDANDNPLD